MKYKNIIFDLGGVMLEWMPEKFIYHVFPEQTPKEFLHITRSLLWYAYDGGLFSREEVIDRLPEGYDRNRFALWMKKLPDLMQPIPGMVELMHGLKRKGCKIYILSNMPREMYHELTMRHSFFEHADGQVISFEAGALKPMPQIYQTLLSRYQLQAADCFFIDDLEDNILAAKRCGIDGVVFQGAAHLQSLESVQ